MDGGEDDELLVAAAGVDAGAPARRRPRAPVDAVAAQARRAIGGIFALNGFAYASVVPRLPAIKRELALSNTAFGTAVAAMPVGALAAGALAGTVILRTGSRRLTIWSAVGLGLLVPTFAVVPAWWALAAAFLALGAVDSAMDVAMNTHSLRVQQAHGHSIVSALHGLWSVGAVLGALVGAATIGLGIPIGGHLAAAGAVIVASALLLGRRLLPGPDPRARSATAAFAPSPSSTPTPTPTPTEANFGSERARNDPLGPEVRQGWGVDGTSAGSVRRARARRLATLGVVVLLAATIEDAASSWAAVLLRTELAATATVAGLGFVAFQAAMTAGRLSGDRLVDRFGPVALVRWSALLVAVGMGTGLLVGTAPSVIAGFALAGLGSAPLFPLVFRASGEVPGVEPGHGVATVALMSRVGFLVSAPLVGLLGDALDLRAALALVPIAAAVLALLAPVVTPADPSAGHHRA